MKIIRKYAVAYLHVFGDDFTQADMVQCRRAAEFLKAHRRALFLLKVPLISLEIKKEGLKDFVKKFELPHSMMALVNLLLEHKRAFLLANILLAIIDIYKETNHIHLVTVSSSIALDAQQQKAIEQFLGAQVSGTLLYSYDVDKKLIAGIRLQSDTVLWERSINKRLREIVSSRSR